MRAIAPGLSAFQGLAVLRDGMIAAAPRAAMASGHVRGEGRPGSRPVACFSPERAEPRDGAPSAVALAISWSGGIWSSRSGNEEDQDVIRWKRSPANGASPMPLVVNAAARISRDFSSMPM